jgi:hypothetical protein
MSALDFGQQFLGVNTMTYWGRRYDANFWIENACVKWNEVEVPFHTVGRPSGQNHNSRRMPRKRPTSTSQDTRRRTASQLEASIVHAGPRTLPAEKHACARRAVVKGNRQSAVYAD